MPNWVYNQLTIEGKPDSVIRLKEQVGKPYIMPVEKYGDLQYKVEDVSVDSPFSFWNIVAPTDLDAYVKQPAFNDNNGTDNSWYNWNMRNWGSKWDSTDAELEQEQPNGDNLVLLYRFETPWGIANEALIKLSSQYPDLLFTLSYEEETGWGGEHEYLNGQALEGSQYNWMCRNCDYQEIGEPPWCDECEYDTCPKCGWGEPDSMCDEHHKLLESLG
jgi:hypothetical protein